MELLAGLGAGRLQGQGAVVAAGQASVWRVALARVLSRRRGRRRRDPLGEDPTASGVRAQPARSRHATLTASGLCTAKLYLGPGCGSDDSRMGAPRRFSDSPQMACHAAALPDLPARRGAVRLEGVVNARWTHPATSTRWQPGGHDGRHSALTLAAGATSTAPAPGDTPPAMTRS